MAQHHGLLLALVLVGGASSVFVACGGDESHPNNLGTGGGSGNDGGGAAGSGGQDTGGFGGFGAGDGSDAGGTGGVNQPGAPEVHVTSPTAAADPVNDDVVTTNQLATLCTVDAATTPNAKPVDASSVKIAVLDDGNNVVDELPGQKTTPNGNEYGASFVISTIDTGKFSVRCTAADTSTPAKTGSDTIDTFVDHGPDIVVTTPAPNSAYPLTGAVPFAFTVSPATLAPGDTEADVESVSLSTNGVNIPATPDPSVTNGYKVAVDYTNTSIFPQPPNGSVPVVIKAKNKRTPTAVERTESYSFAVDGAGPVITVKSPKNQDVIGGQVVLSFSVVDSGSGVNKNSVSVKLNQDAPALYAPNVEWTNTGDDFTYTFDSANVGDSGVQITVSLTANDVVGNTSPGASVVLYLDNVGPIVDLDPPNVRTRKKAGANEICSAAFDPLGTFAAYDGETDTTPFKHFRALVWDKTNEVSGQTVLYYAKTDQTSVRLYLQPDGPTIPLLINNDADAACDALNTTVAGNPIPSLALNDVTPAGSAWYTNSDPTASPPISSTSDPTCIMNTENPPNKLCTGASDLSVVIRHTMSGIEPVVYGIGNMTGLECTGTGWELSSQLANATQKEGWFCLAATAKDQVGNASISRPLRVCYDDPNTSFQPACANSSTTPPSCTDGCTPPPGFPATIFPAP